ncbi:leucyl aminopeptidase [Cricetibacter osteomyelitidis]|uniref:Probable cytosol aminopeptidase n=1 Tax=Cricetibacter osteomyelitidis TaxID=1521931 RepID=A0A4R2SPE8_9PAST|nr:leucyl aminopeptidase [Cricetibacter osteomyelitidis]TCP92009.1 leucyl aminopeptidase [Cricetibacter osteomyelitidis]
MKFDVEQYFIDEKTDCLVVGIYENGEFTNAAKQLNQFTDGILDDLFERKDITGKVGEAFLLSYVPTLLAERILLVGCGKKGEALTERQYKQCITKMIQVLKDTGSHDCLCFLAEVPLKNRDTYWNVRFAIEAIATDLYRFEQFKSKKNETTSQLQQIRFTQPDIAALETLQQAIKDGQAIALGIETTKNIANCPPNVCTPAYLAEQAKALALTYSFINTEIIDEAQMAELGMNAYLAVSQGSKNEAFLSLIEYKNHPNPDANPIVLVGKGLTFDAGGISLKPSDSMDEMKYDMCGAATVYGVMKAVAELQLPLNIIGVLAGCENLPDGNAYRPGDILTTMNGLTVEVLNTDAEGRLVLCDTLTYVERFNPDCVIDVATLTGACVVALGQHNSGLISPNDKLAQALLEAATQANDKAWQLPLSEEYQEQLKSNFADLANIGGRWGGAITAGAFLSNFTKKYPWAHLDIAGTAWLQGANKGATGRPVALLVQFLLNQVER